MSVIKRPVRVWGNGSVVVDPDGNTVCDVTIGDLDLERKIAAEIVEALNGVGPNNSHPDKFDMVDKINELLWNAASTTEIMQHLAVISDETWAWWLGSVRTLLKKHDCNRYFGANGEVRTQP